MEAAMYNNITTKKPITFNLLDVLVWFYMAHRVLPAVGQYTPGIVFLGVFAMLALTLCISKRNMINTPAFAKLIFVFSVSLLTLAMRMAEGNMTTTFTYAYGQLQSFLYGWIAIDYISKVNITKTRRLLNLTIVFYVITIVTTYVGNIMYPQASRLLATLDSNNSTYQLYTSLNIGGFSFVYEVALLMPLVVYLIKSGKLTKVWGAVILVFIGIFLMQAEYTTALIMFLLTTCLLFFKTLSTKKIIAIVLVIAIFVLVFGGLVSELMDSVADIVPSDTISVRLKYAAALLRGEKLEESIETEAEAGSRAELYKKAFKQMIDTKFMGSWGEVNGSGHSFILDNIVRFGVLGILAILVAYRMMYCIAIRPHKNKDYYPYLVWMFIMAIVLAVLNTKLNQYIFIFMIPLFACVIDNKEQNKQEG